LRASERRGAIADRREMSSTTETGIFILLSAAKVEHLSEEENMIVQKVSLLINRDYFVKLFD
jgi:hypothetical protein